ncbi:MAG: DUF167 domain-containing protein [Candidatus Bathyarchaeota archaeon]|nr:DUF167 domain-containing protein [Candidatus Termiticorpusculum sp.]
MCIKETVDYTLITIFVKPNSSKFAIKIEDDEIIVYATEKPENGKVNKEILKELTRIFHVKVKLVSGTTSRQKQLAIKIKKEKLEQILKKK